MFCVKSENLKYVGDLECGSFGSIKIAQYKQHHKRSFVSLNRLEQHPARSIESYKVKRYQQLLLKLGHEHIVQFFGLIKSGNVYVVMELPRLGSLLACVKEDPPIPDETLDAYFTTNCSGINLLGSKSHCSLRFESRKHLAHDTFLCKNLQFDFSQELPRNINHCDFEDSRDTRETYSERYRWAAKECLQYNTASASQMFGVSE